MIDYLDHVIIPKKQHFERRDPMEKFKNLGETLTKLRKEKNLLQSEVAALLEERGISVTNQGVSKWETNKVVPNAIQFLNLCDILGIEDVMSTFSDGYTGFQSGLNADGRKMVTELIHFLSENPKFSNNPVSE